MGNIIAPRSPLSGNESCADADHSPGSQHRHVTLQRFRQNMPDLSENPGIPSPSYHLVSLTIVRSSRNCSIAIQRRLVDVDTASSTGNTAIDQIDGTAKPALGGVLWATSS